MNESSDLISVIVPVYKVEDLLSRCVDSITQQSYQNLEIILVDDGSPDRCGEICDDYARRDGRVRVIHKLNGGVSDARNAALTIATGSYLTFVDSDDWIHADYVSTLYRLSQEHGSEISASRFLRTDRFVKDAAPSEPSVQTLSRDAVLEQLVGRLHTLLTVPWAKLYKSELFTGTTFPVGRIHEDEFTTYRVLAHANSTTLTSASLYYYWQRPESIMGVGKNKKGSLDAIDAYRERARFLEQLPMPRLLGEANAQMFRKLLQLYRWLDPVEEQPLRAELMVEMKQLVKKMRNMRLSPAFRAFSGMYVRAPRLVEPVYNVFTRVNPRTRPHGPRKTTR